MKTKLIFLYVFISCITVVSCHKDDDEALPEEYIKVNIKGTNDDGIYLK